MTWQEDATTLRKEGKKVREIAKTLGIPKSTVHDHLKRSGFIAQKPEQRKPKILLLDIETSPSLAYVWGRFKQYVNQEQVISEGFILSYCCKWLGDTGVYADMGTVEEIMDEDDKRITSSLRDFLDQADIIIAHNLRGFDEKVINARMLFWGMTPPSAYKTVDTLQIAKSNFRFPSNKLDSLGEYLKVGRKVPHSGFSLWKGVMDGREEDRKTMMEYNIGDVELLEEVYLALRAWDQRHPNVSHYYNDTKIHCVCCGSTKMLMTGNKVYTPLSAFDEYVCGDCGKRSRNRTNSFSKQKREATLLNIL